MNRMVYAHKQISNQFIEVVSYNHSKNRVREYVVNNGEKTYLGDGKLKNMKVKEFRTLLNNYKNGNVESESTDMIIVNNVPVTIKEWNGQRVVTYADVDRVHGRPEGTCKRNFQYQKSHFVEGEDYFKLSKDEFRPFGENPNYNYPRGGYLITEKGYLLLIKSFNDDLAWEVQKQLVAAYFQITKDISEKNEKPKRKYTKRKNEELPIIIETPTTTSIMEQPKTNDILNKFFDVQMKQIELQNKQIQEMSKIMNSMLDYLMNIPKISPMTTLNSIEKIPGINMESVYGYEEWKREINKAADMIVNLDSDKYKTRNNVLSDAYRLLRKEYGIVWEQEKKEFYQKMDRSPVNTLELAWYIEQRPIYSNMLLAKLNNIYHEVKHQ